MKCKCSNCQITWPDFQFGVPKQRNVAAKLISYKRYGEILFQKVASGCLLHFARDRSSNTLQKISCSANMSNIKQCFFLYIFPPNSRSTAPLRRLFMLVFVVVGFVTMFTHHFCQQVLCLYHYAIVHPNCAAIPQGHSSPSV